MEYKNGIETGDRQQSQSSAILPITVSLNRYLASLEVDSSTPLMVLDSPTIPEITQYEYPIIPPPEEFRAPFSTQPLNLIVHTQTRVTQTPSDETLQNLTVVDEAMNCSVSLVSSRQPGPPLTPSIEDLETPQKSSTPLPPSRSESPSFSLSSAQVLDEWHAGPSAVDLVQPEESI